MVNINRLSTIWCLLARDTRHAQFVDKRDIKTFIRRTNSEGIAFIARELPRLRGVTLAGIETGWINTSHIDVRFGSKSNSVLPRFMYGAFSSVFTDEGMLRSDYDVGAIDTLNSLLGLFKKLNGGHTAASEQEVQDNFVANEVKLKSHWFWKMPVYLTNGYIEDEHGLARVRAVADRAARSVRRVLSGLNPFDITPKHSAGTSACGTPFHMRFGKPQFYRKIDRLWPYSEFWTLGANHLCDDEAPFCVPKIPLWDKAPPGHDGPRAKAILVPKDCRGMRLISCEPRETMWIQQGVMTKLMRRLESHSLTRQRINFADQTINQKLACEGSLTGSQLTFHYGKPVAPRLGKDWATLDLKDASDLVALDLVRLLFPDNWVEALEACRSETTVLPDGRIVEMAKHAPMGSAVCFPVMALCIWSIVSESIHLVSGSYQPVYVYGDDIIIPARYRKIATQALTTFGLVVNESKSYSTGPFRESCGKEYVNGIDVTPTYVSISPDDDDYARLRMIAFYNNCYRKYSGPETIVFPILTV